MAMLICCKACQTYHIQSMAIGHLKGKRHHFKGVTLDSTAIEDIATELGVLDKGAIFPKYTGQAIDSYGGLRTKKAYIYYHASCASFCIYYMVYLDYL